ncbi:MAG TPA: endolytic transglycosylase MltG [Terracidiphilus sp.]|nr:endolytic transglycosylase MltG [Terracidiphilus sp.]
MARQRRKGNHARGLGATGTRLVLLLVLASAVGAAAWLMAVPYGPETETFVEIAPGEPTARIAGQLEAAGIIRSRYAFDLLRWVKRGRLEAGEYRFDHPALMTEVYARIERGDVYTRTVVVPEGANIFEIGQRIEEAGLGTEDEFLQAQAENAGMIHDLDPQAKSLEGYLFPDTYAFTRAETMKQILTTMVGQFRKEAAELDLNQNVHNVVTMASLVERETAVSGERPIVASVFENRLQKKIPLGTDPSVIYGLELEGEWRGRIYASDLKRNTPYNTYLHAGLPPGPIANPGAKALRAAMHPAETTYLYFVAAGTNPQGRSLFASTLGEHARNVAGYRKAVKKAGEP